jgi:hypothetical protein
VTQRTDQQLTAELTGVVLSTPIHNHQSTQTYNQVEKVAPEVKEPKGLAVAEDRGVPPKPRPPSPPNNSPPPTEDTGARD